MSVVAVFSAEIGLVSVCEVFSGMKIGSCSDCPAHFRHPSTLGLNHERAYVVEHLILGTMGILRPNIWALVEFMHLGLR